MTSTTAISDFLNWLKLSEKEYFIPWGYEKLPEVSGGDLDICVHEIDYYPVSQWLKNHKFNQTQCPRYGNNHKHEYYVGDFTVDMWTSFCFSYEGKTVILDINPDLFFDHTRTKFDGTKTSDFILEALFTSLRIVGGRKDCAKRLEKYLLY